MQNQLLTLAFVFLFLFTIKVQAQENFFGNNFVGAKVLFVDYGTPNDMDSLDITNGLEVVYLRNINPYLKIGIPLKAGVANVQGDINNRTFLSGDAVVQLQYYQPQARVVPYVFGGAGLTWEDVLGTHLQIPVGAGLNLRVGENSYINLQGEYRVASEENRNNLQAGLGFVYRLGLKKPDLDGDGVPDETDECPEIPGLPALGGCPDLDQDGIADKDDKCPDAPGEALLMGCPDTDGDGLADKDDDCPTVAGTVNGCPDSDGDGIVDEKDECPSVAGPAATNGCPDRDGDGVIDKNDECPEEAGPAANRGCPSRDRDGDGVADDADRCPDTAGLVALQGCPDQDGDGVADKDDRCPEKAGPYTGCPDTDGDGLIDPDDSCPEQAGPTTNKGCPELKEEEKEVLIFAMQAVQFETGKATLKEESYNILDQIASIMQRYPGYKLRISGHTDSVGDADNNQVLSEDRAKACYQYMMASGIMATRMTYAGYGETKPIADNDRSRGRRLNRRVEFELYVE